ncbi:hypothetical protein EDB86DRAFT_2829989 [Lactarius hatsudake]|nr:hypothetical protein EDB86DRAFT_2829989 [Lactarius hatsudake]
MAAVRQQVAPAGLGMGTGGFDLGPGSVWCCSQMLLETDSAQPGLWVGAGLGMFGGMEGGAAAPGGPDDVRPSRPVVRQCEERAKFEGMTRKMVVDGRAALGARRKMVKTFEVVRWKMGIDDPTAPPRRRSLADLN